MKASRSAKPALWGALLLVCAAALVSSTAATDQTVGSLGQETESVLQRVSPPRIESGISFAGEALPLERVGVRERMERELLIGTFRHSSSLLTLKRSGRWFPIIEPILVDSGIPTDFKYLSVIESGLANAVSPSDARGFWQFMKPAAEEFGLRVDKDVDERYHVEKATRAACAYLNKAYDRYGDWVLAAASYNMGMSGLSRRMDEQSGSTYWDLLLNDETARYVYRLFATKQVMESPEAHGFVLRAEDWYAPLETRDTVLVDSVDDLAAFAQKLGVSYNALKTLNPWLRSGRLPIADDQYYVLCLPLR
ncbi:MAG: lytic transglycosylase domain-containing protein [Flavobacteriales bacterium]|nr:lytic transglycosylase domain-containing protein [Flavobacteriales bacterium]